MKRRGCFWRGEAVLRVRGASPERFVDACARRGVTLSRVERPDGETLIAHTSAAEARAVRDLPERLGLEGETVRERGLPALRRRAGARGVLAAGLIFALLALCVSQMFLWEVRTEGLSRPERRRVLDALSRAGVGIGTFLPGVDAELVQTRLLAELPELKWIALNLRGSVAEISLRKNGPAAGSEEIPGDLVADRDGVITGIAVGRGTAAVRPGDAVVRGDVLVWGYEENASGVRTPVRASAWTEADCVGEYRGQCDGELRAVVYTGECITRRRLIFGKNPEKIFAKSRILPAGYDKIEVKTEGLFSLWLLTETARAYRVSGRPLDPPSAERILLSALRARAERERGAVLSETFELTRREQTYEMVYRCRTLGPIGKIRE